MKEWHEEARELRAQGWKLRDIGKKFDVTEERIRQITRGITCPIEHRGAHFSDPEWRKKHPRSPVKRLETAGFIRKHYGTLSAAQIGLKLGISRNAVIGRARDMGLCKRASS